MPFQPIIKWSGSKRSQCESIVRIFPQNIDTYYEPFCGGGSVMRAVLESNILLKKVVCSDINADLIKLWNAIKDDPITLIESYSDLWHQLNKDNNQERRNLFYLEIRERLNKEHSPFDFNFIMRNAINGMPRYNSKGNFNSAFHYSRKGISPIHFKQIAEEWHELLLKNNVIFQCGDYSSIRPGDNDFVYLDPPYSHSKGLYFGCIDLERLWDWMSHLKCGYILSFDGKVGDENPIYSVPHNLYTNHIFVNSGKSSFRRLIKTANTNKDDYVFESVYIK